MLEGRPPSCRPRRQPIRRARHWSPEMDRFARRPNARLSQIAQQIRKTFPAPLGRRSQQRPVELVPLQLFKHQNGRRRRRLSVGPRIGSSWTRLNRWASGARPSPLDLAPKQWLSSAWLKLRQAQRERRPVGRRVARGAQFSQSLVQFSGSRVDQDSEEIP